MKTLAVWTLMAAVMIVSQPSYAIGDLLFHTILKGAMTDSSMVSATPTYGRTAEERTQFAVLDKQCPPIAPPSKLPLPDGYVLIAGALYEQDCYDRFIGKVVPDVVEPVPTTRMPCTTSKVVAAARGDLDEEELNLLDQNCNPHTTELSTSASAMGFGLSVAEETCAMWYPTSTVLGLFGAWTSNPPKDYVRYGAGYAHKDCVPQ